MLKKFILLLFLFVIFSLIVSSFFPQELSHKYFYQALWFRGLWFVVSIGIIISIVNFVKRKNFGFTIIYLSILLILIGALFTSLGGEEGFMEIKEGQTQNGFWIEDELFRLLDFSISLKDFSVEYYPERIGHPDPLKEGPYPEQKEAMRFVKSYRSKVAITKEENLLKEGIIEVNKPLSFGGFSFFQYAYDVNFPNQTILQVVKDPGLPLVYVGYLVLLIGMILSFKRIFFSI